MKRAERRRVAAETTLNYLIAVANAANMRMFEPSGRAGVVRFDRSDDVVAQTLDDLADLASEACANGGPAGIRAFWQASKTKLTESQLTALWDGALRDILDELDPLVPRDSVSMAEWVARQAGLR